jgi:hypothetical protein
MILWLLLYTLLAHSQSDPAIEEYCFSSIEKMKLVSTRLKFILVPADKTQEDRNCFTVSTPTHRRELIQNYVRRLDPAVQIGFSSAEIRRDPCNIKVEKFKTVTKQSTVGSISTGFIPSAGTEQTNGQSSDITSIQTLKEFELTVNQDVVKGECRAINPTRYEISIEVRKDAPPTPVAFPGSEMPKQEDTSRLQTTLQLNVGERIEIGSVVKNLKSGGATVNINSGAALEKSDNTQNEKVFLSIN